MLTRSAAPSFSAISASEVPSSPPRLLSAEGAMARTAARRCSGVAPPCVPADLAMRALALRPAATSFRRESACTAASATWLALPPSSSTALAPAPASGRLELTEMVKRHSVPPPPP